MDNQRFREAYARLQRLDEGTTYKLRDRGRSPSRLSTDQLEDRLREVAHYTLDLKEILQELFLAIGTNKPTTPASTSPGTPGPSSPDVTTTD